MINSDATKRTFPFFQILTLIFITLKLIGYITWSWWWVLSPIILPFAIVLLIGFMVITVKALTR